MNDLEERPSKIRKISAPEEAGNSSHTSKGNSNQLPAAPLNPTINETKSEDVSDVTVEPQAETEIKPALSKSQLKKIRKQEAWEAGKDDRRLKRREKHKEKQARKAAARDQQAALIASEGLPVASPDPVPAIENGKAKPRGTQRPIQVPLSLILDCDFNDLMSDKELISLAAQVTRCYSDNRSAVYRSHIAISSWGGALQERFEGPLSKNHLGWKGVRFIPEHFVDAAKELNAVMRGPQGGKLVGALKEDLVEETNGSSDDQAAKTERFSGVINGATQEATEAVQNSAPSEDLSKPEHPATEPSPAGEPIPAPEEPIPIPPPSLVYLTSDSPHTLTRLSPNTSYIIGGIVDKNRHKGICYKRAQQLGIPTAKLPIGEYMTMQSRTVLAVNHVVEIMLKWLEEGDWGEAFLRVIPKRKEARLKRKKGEEESGDGDGEEDGDADGDEGAEDRGGTEAEGEGEAEEEADAGGDVEMDAGADVEAEADVVKGVEAVADADLKP